MKLIFKILILSCTFILTAFYLKGQNEIPSHLDLFYDNCKISPANEKNKFIYADKLKKIDFQLLNLLKENKNEIYIISDSAEYVVGSELTVLQDYAEINYSLKVQIIKKNTQQIVFLSIIPIEKDFNIKLNNSKKTNITKYTPSNIFFNDIELDLASIFNPKKTHRLDTINVLVLPFKNFGLCDNNIDKLCLSTLKDKLSEIKEKEELKINIKINTQVNIDTPISYEDAKKLGILTHSDIVIYGQYDPNCETGDVDHIRINLVVLNDYANIVFKKSDHTFQNNNSLSLYDLEYEGDITDVLFFMSALGTEDCSKVEGYFKKIKNFKNMSSYYRRTGSCHLNLDNKEKAFAIYSEGLKLFPFDNTLMKSYAEVAEQLNKDAIADSVYKEMINIDPKWNLFYTNFLYNTGQTDKLTSVCSNFHNSFKEVKDYAHIKYIMAFALNVKYNNSLALLLINDALHVKQNDETYLLLRAKINKNLKNFTEVESDYQFILENGDFKSTDYKEALTEFISFYRDVKKDTLNLIKLYEHSISDIYKTNQDLYINNVKNYVKYLLSVQNFSKAVSLLESNSKILEVNEWITLCQCKTLNEGRQKGKECIENLLNNQEIELDGQSIIESTYYKVYDDSIRLSISYLNFFLFLFEQEIKKEINFREYANQNKMTLSKEIIEKTNLDQKLLSNSYYLLFSLYLDSLLYNLDSATLYLNKYLEIKDDVYTTFYGLDLISGEKYYIFNSSNTILRLKNLALQFFKANLTSIKDKNMAKRLIEKLYNDQLNALIGKSDLKQCIFLMNQVEENKWFYTLNLDDFPEFYNQKTNFYIQLNEYENAVLSLTKYLNIQDNRNMGQYNSNFLNNSNFDVLRKNKQFKKLVKKYKSKN